MEAVWGLFWGFDAYADETLLRLGMDEIFVFWAVAVA